MRVLRNLALVSAIVVVSFFLISRAYAQPVTVELTVVKASNESDVRDPKLGHLIEELDSVFSYSSYTELARHTVTLEVGDSWNQALLNNTTIDIVQKEVTEDSALLHVSLKEGKSVIIETDFSIVNGGTILLGGPKINEGRLIIGILVKY